MPISKSELDYRAEDDHRTLERASEITADESRMAGVRKHHAKKRAAGQRMDALLKGRRAPKRSMPGR